MPKIEKTTTMYHFNNIIEINENQQIRKKTPGLIANLKKH